MVYEIVSLNFRNNVFLYVVFQGQCLPVHCGVFMVSLDGQCQPLGENIVGLDFDYRFMISHAPTNGHQPFGHNLTEMALSLTRDETRNEPKCCYFNIESYNGIPTIANYIRSIKDPFTQETFDSTTKNIHMTSSSSISSNTIASIGDITLNNTHKKVASHLSTNNSISSRNISPQTDTTHSLVIKLITQLHEQKKQITSFEANIL